MELEKDKLKCDQCQWDGRYDDVLTASNPFDEDETIYGCPRCHSIDSFNLLCDEPGCKDVVCCGMNTEDGYRNTCHQHAPM